MTPRPPTAALAGALVFAAVVAGAIAALAPPPERALYLAYDVPIAVPFFLFVVDRWSGRLDRALDVSVVAAALVRAVYFVPLYSGHALFLTYAAWTVASAWARGAAVLVLIEVTWFKFSYWSDERAYAGGVLLGSAVGWWYRRRARPPTG